MPTLGGGNGVGPVDGGGFAVVAKKAAVAHGGSPKWAPRATLAEHWATRTAPPLPTQWAHIMDSPAGRAGPQYGITRGSPSFPFLHKEDGHKLGQKRNPHEPTSPLPPSSIVPFLLAPRTDRDTEEKVGFPRRCLENEPWFHGRQSGFGKRHPSLSS